MAETLIGITFFNESSNQVKPGTAILDVEGDLVSLDGKPIIDARDKPRLGNPNKGWTDRGELAKFGEVIDAIRTICETGVWYNDVNVDEYRLLIRAAAVKSLKELGFGSVKDINILGKIPDWWTSRQKVTKRWVLDYEKWQTRKKELHAFYESIQPLSSTV